MGEYTSSIGKRLPIDGVAARTMLSGALNKGLGNSLDPLSSFREGAGEAIDKVFDYLNVRSHNPQIKYPRDTTLNSLNREINIVENSILRFNSYFNTLELEAGLLKSFLQPALSNLITVKTGMKATLAREGNFNSDRDKMSTLDSKMEWMGRLSLSKVLISSGVETPIFIGNKASISPAEVNERFKKSDIKFSRLQAIISQRQDGEDIGAQILDLANNSLKSFILGPLSLFNPNSRTKAISSLRAIQVLLRDLISTDNAELQEANSFIYSVERNPLFNTLIKPSWDSFMNSLESAPLAGRIPEDLKKGDLTNITNALSAGRFAYDTTKDFLNCRINVGEEDMERLETLSNIIGGDSEESKRIARKSDAVISKLKNEQIILNKILED